MRRRRVVGVGAVLAVFLCVACGVPLLFVPALTPLKHDQIELGMTRVEVEAILGPPTEQPGQWYSLWASEEGETCVHYAKQTGRACFVNFIPTEGRESPFHAIRRWLGLSDHPRLQRGTPS